MLVYLVILEDRHTDVEVRVFATKDAAMAAFRAIVEEYGYEDPEPMEDSEWLANARLSGEGDYVRVEAAEVNG